MPTLSSVVEELVIDEGSCNSMKGNYVIDDFVFLRSIVVKKSALKYLNSFWVHDCIMLERIEMEGSEGSGYVGSALKHVNIVEISSNSITLEIIGSSSFRTVSNRSKFMLIHQKPLIAS